MPASRTTHSSKLGTHPPNTLHYKDRGYTRSSNPNFLELRQHEVRRTPLLRTSVNRGKRKVQSGVVPLTSTERCSAFALVRRARVVLSSPSLTQLAVEIEGGAYEGKVGKGLREVA